MFSPREFLGIEVGNMFEYGTVLDGVTKEKIVFICREAVIHPQRKTNIRMFSMTYLDCDLGIMQGELVPKGSSLDECEVVWRDKG